MADLAITAPGEDQTRRLRIFGLVPARTLARNPLQRELQTFRVKGHDLRMAL